MARTDTVDGIELGLQLVRPGFALDVQATLPARGITALFGPSGCGKTTVLRALAGLERAQGRITVSGEVWQDDGTATFLAPHRRPVGYVLQDAALFPHLTVRRNLDYGHRRVPSDQRRIEPARAVSLLGIGPLLDRRPMGLSGGERQRVAIARALLTSPRLLLMDEPLAALDAGRKAEILPYLERLHHELAMPIVYVTHSLDEVARLADHLVLMSDGRVVAQGALVELMARVDLPLGGVEETGALLSAIVAEHDAPYGLTRLALAHGMSLWIGGVPHPVGRDVRVRVLARDVSVVRTPPEATSILNVLPVTLAVLQPRDAVVTLGLRLGHGEAAGVEAPQLLARITRRSADALALRPGDRLFAQIKGAALMR